MASLLPKNPNCAEEVVRGWRAVEAGRIFHGNVGWLMLCSCDKVAISWCLGDSFFRCPRPKLSYALLSFTLPKQESARAPTTALVLICSIHRTNHKHSDHQILQNISGFLINSCRVHTEGFTSYSFKNHSIKNIAR